MLVREAGVVKGRMIVKERYNWWLKEEIVVKGVSGSSRKEW